MTCVELGLECMKALRGAGNRVAAVLTLEDDVGAAKSGRVYLDRFCSEAGWPLVKVRSINDPQSVAAIRGFDLDWLLIIGWSQVAGREVLASVRHGVLGMHPTLLPQGRGRAPIPWAIIRGLSRTGVTLFKLDEGVDTGPIAAQMELELAADETATGLYARVASAQAELLCEYWPQLLSGTASFRPQNDDHASVWPGRTPEDGEILPTMSGADADRLVRATTHPYPGAFWREGHHLVRVWAGFARHESLAGSCGQPEIALSDGYFVATDFEMDG